MKSALLFRPVVKGRKKACLNQRNDCVPRFLTTQLDTVLNRCKSRIEIHPVYDMLEVVPDII
jgi:hypothetical protein